MTKEIFNVQDLSDYLQISKSQIYKLTSKREIPFYKPKGKLLFFFKKEIDNWILESKVMTNKEYENQLQGKGI